MANHVEIDENVLRKFAQKLAGNEKKIRDIGLKRLRKWMTSRASGEQGAFTEEDMMKLWKGLHYCMWMSDKPLVQEELADRLAGLVDCFKEDMPSAFTFIDTFFKTQCREWSLLDRLRLDKFMMLIRKFLNRSLALVQSHSWKKKHVKRLLEVLCGHIISPTNDDVPLGLKLHIADIYMDELEKIGIGEISAEQVQTFLDPYCIYISKETNQQTVGHIIKRVFCRLIDYAFDEQEPDSEDEEEEDVENDTPSRLQVDYSALADRLFELASSTDCRSKNRKAIYNLVKTLRDLAQGVLPQEEEISSGEETLTKKEMSLAVDRMQHFEAQLNRGKKRKIQKRKKKRSKQGGNSDGGDESEGDSDGDSDGDDKPPPKKQKTSQSTSKTIKKGKTASKKTEESTTNIDKTRKKKKALKSLKAKENVIENGDDLEETMESEACDDNNNDMASENSAKKKKKSKKKRESGELKSGHSESMDVSVANAEDDNEVSVKADIVVPSRRGKLKDLVQQNYIEKPGVKVVEDTGPVDSDVLQANVMASILKSKSAEDEVESLFTGGFVDSDDEEKEAKKRKKKEAKLRRKSLPTKLSSEEDNNEFAGKQQKINDTTETIDESTTNDGVKTKKLKRESTGSVQLGKKNNVGNEHSVKGKKNKKNEIVENGFDEDGEYEILIPNKKYQGKYKKAFENEIEKAMGKDDVKTKEAKKGSAFATFEKMTKTPPAFVKKAVAKVLPKTKKSPKLSPDKMTASTEGNRRVSFGLHKNKAQEFAESLNKSPVVPFDPKVTPNQSILKSTPLSQTRRPSLGSSPKLNLQKKLAKQRKPRAEDFF